jgi:hypothetical protein
MPTDKASYEGMTPLQKSSYYGPMGPEPRADSKWSETRSGKTGTHDLTKGTGDAEYSKGMKYKKGSSHNSGGMGY